MTMLVLEMEIKRGIFGILRLAFRSAGLQMSPS